MSINPEVLSLLRQALRLDKEAFEAAISDYQERGDDALKGPGPGAPERNVRFVLMNIWWRVELARWEHGTLTKAYEAVHQEMRGKSGPDFIIRGRALNPCTSARNVRALYDEARERRKSDPDFADSCDWFLSVFKEAAKTGKNPADVAKRL